VQNAVIPFAVAVNSRPMPIQSCWIANRSPPSSAIRLNGGTTSACTSSPASRRRASAVGPPAVSRPIGSPSDTAVTRSSAA
jgi:hypothetical protein